MYCMQKLTYRTIEKESMFEIPKIKWSRFLCYLFPCDSKEVADTNLEKIKKEHFSATHHCSARRIWTYIHEDLFGNILIEPKSAKGNDDWEPTNTAGKPILNVLEWEKLLNIEAIVVRHFWGTLLGVGWLIQAYTQATKEAIMNKEIVEKEILQQIELEHNYNQTSLVAHLIGKFDAKLISETCNEKSKKILTINYGYVTDFEKELFDASNGSLKIG